MNDDDPKVYQPKLDKNGEPCPEPEPSPMLETASGSKEPSTNCHSRHHQPSVILIPSSYSRSPFLYLLKPTGFLFRIRPFVLLILSNSSNGTGPSNTSFSCTFLLTLNICPPVKLVPLASSLASISLISGKLCFHIFT